MKKQEYQTGFQRLEKRWTDTNERYMNALLAVKENFSGFTKKDGFNPARPDKLSAAQKHQIRRYYNTLTEYTEGGQVYKMKASELPKEIKKFGKKGFDAVKQSAQMTYGRKRAKFAFIPFDGENIPKIKLYNGTPVFVNEKIGYMKMPIFIGAKGLAQDPQGAIMHAMGKAAAADFYKIMAGKHEVTVKSGLGKAADIETLAAQVDYLMEKYAIGNVKENHVWNNWLLGVNAYYGISPTKYDQYSNAAREAWREKVKKENAKARKVRK